MSTDATYPHLTIDKQGQARICNSRYKVRHIAAEHYHYGWTAEELLRQHPDLKPEEVYAALTYFYDHHEAMVAEMKKSLDSLHPTSPAQPLSREELLRRSAAREN